VSDGSEAGGARTEVRRFLEILALTGAAVVEPVLSNFGEAPDTFIGAEASRGQIVLFGLVVALGPAVVAWAAGWLAGRIGGSRVRRATHLVTVGGLSALVVIRVVKRVGPPPAWLVTVAAVAGAVAAGWLYRRVAAARAFLGYAAVLPVLLFVMFIGFSPVSKLVFPPAASTPAPTHGGSRTPILMIVADELPTETLLDRSNHVDRDLFPNLARLAGEATWYRNHTAVASFTQAAVPAIVSGRYPTAPMPVPTQFSENLFTWLEPSYTINGWESITRLCTAPGCNHFDGSGALSTLVGEAWEQWSHNVQPWTPPATAPIEDDPLGRAISRRATRLDGFTASLDRPMAPPRLDFLHVLLPHIPWEYLPDGRRYPEPEFFGLFVNGWVSPYSAELGRQRHVLQAQYFDRRLGEIIGKLRRSGRYDETLVIVTADHGMRFRSDEPWRGVSADDYSSLPWAPLFVKYPGQTEGRLDESNVEQIDILPTIAEAIGTRLPWKVDGRSVRHGSTRAPEAKWIFPWGQDRMPTGPDGRIRLDAVTGYRAMLDAPPAVEAQGPDRVFRLPPYGGLVGRRVSSLPVGEPVHVRFRTDDGGRLHYDGGREIPVYIKGRFDREVRSGRFAVAVDGVVGGWFEMTPVLKSTFAVLVPPRLVPRGESEVSVYRIDGSPDRPTLRPVPGP